MITPQYFAWDNGVMTPLRPSLADKQFSDGETYRLGVVEERSTNSHAAYFAAVNEAWNNLPEAQTERFPTSDHLRKWALVEAGYFLQQEFVASSKAQARRLATLIGGMDEYSIVSVRDKAVIRRVPKSQSYAAMGKAEFQDSKAKVLDILAALVGVTAKAIKDNTGRAA